MRLLLTGGNGLVGRNILADPKIASWEVTAPRRSELDLRDAAAVDDFIAAFQPDIIIHVAGRVGGIMANMAHPVEFLVENLDMGRNVIMAALGQRIPRLLNVGSSCMYPREGANPLREASILDGALEPTNEGYALAKIVAQRLCHYVSASTPDLSYKTLIPCNIYGRFDHFDPTAAHLVPAVIRKIHDAKVAGDTKVVVWGDGTARREFMYAADLADAILSAARDFDRIPAIMNIGLGHDHSIIDYYRAVAEVVGWKGEFAFDSSKPTGMKQKLVDTSRQEAWGWRPATSLHDGIAATYDFYLDQVAA